jgi:hypothetical protein
MLHANRSEMPKVELRFSWPEAPGAPFREDFFFGVWHPVAEVEVVTDTPPKTIDPVIVRTPNVFLASNSSEFLPRELGTVHKKTGACRLGSGGHCVSRLFISPLYYRQLGNGTVLFASSSRYL